MRQRTLVVGDIHGRFSALKEVLEKSKFKYRKDKLIVLGDIVDGGFNTYEVVEELLKIKNLVFIIGNHDCLAIGTEILTKKGWQRIEKWDGSDIAQYDISSEKINFSQPTHIITEKIQECISIESYDSKQVVSLNHEVLVGKEKIKAYKLLKQDIKNINLPNSGFSENKGIKLNDDLIKLYVWVITDGCIFKSTPKKHRIQFKLSKEKKIDSLKSLLKKLKIKFTFRKASMSPTNILQPHMITIYGDEARKISSYLKEGKQIPKSWKDLSKHQIEILFKTLLETDASLSYNKIEWISINKSNLDIIQSACVKNGFRTSLRCVKNGSGFKNGKEQFRLTYYRGKRTNFKVEIKKVGKIPTYCFTMPLGTLVTRNDGKIAITGNCWFMDHIASGWAEEVWLSQGGTNTLRSYKALVVEEKHMYDNFHIILRDANIPESHKEFFNKGKYYHIENNKLFVHGGFRRDLGIEKTTKHDLVWDRELIQDAKEGYVIPNFKEVYVGHTSTQFEGSNPNIKDCLKPIWFNNLCMMDTGAGGSGKLTMMDIDTKEIWQSEKQNRATFKFMR